MYAKRLNKKILEFCEVNGRDKSLALCESILKSEQHKKDRQFRNEIHGEVCESVLEICIKDYIIKNNLQDTWFYSKGMVLKDPDNPNSDYLTELDFTLFTPFKVLTIECKSYAGNKKLVNECTVIRPKVKPYDIYKQHRGHFRTLIKNIEPCRLKNEYTEKYARLQIGYFDYSMGKLVDEREEEWKKKMPVLNVENIDSYLNKYRNKPTCWNISMLQKMIAIINKHSAVYRKKHLKYVKELNKNRK